MSSYKSKVEVDNSDFWLKDVEFDMVCPKCGSNRWKLRYKGCCDTQNGFCVSTESVSTYIGVFGTVFIVCLSCGYSSQIDVGSD